MRNHTRTLGQVDGNFGKQTLSALSLFECAFLPETKIEQLGNGGARIEVNMRRTTKGVFAVQNKR